MHVRFYVLLAFLSFLSLVVYAQNGTIAGKVVDVQNQEPIIGANVVIQGTSVGAASDLDGNFTIPNVKPGTYVIVVSFVTYKTQTITDVVVQSGMKTTLGISLAEDVAELQAVVVEATREINTDVSLLSAIRESKLVVSGISSEQITRSQDRDAAQVVRRVPGVTIQDNRFVVVRGLAPRYSNVILNGVLAPSTEADSRAFSFDMVPSGALDRMLIYKSGAAELPGDFAGAVVQVTTKSSFESNFTNFSLSTAYRAGTTFTTQQSQQRSATEFIGFDGGFRAIPSGAPSDYRNLGFDVNRIEAESRRFKNTWGLENINALPDMRMSFDFGRIVKKTGKVSISTINSINYSNTNQYNEIEFNRFFNYDSLGRSRTLFNYQDDQFTNNVRLGVLSNWIFRYSPTSRIEFRNLYNRMGTTQTTVRTGDNFLREQNYRNYSLRYIERGVYSGQVEGKHSFNNETSKLNWLVGFTQAVRNEPDWKRLVTARPLNSNEDVPYRVAVPSSVEASNAARFYQFLDEYNVTTRLDYERKINKLEMKAGYWLEYKSRDFQARQIGHVRRDQFDETIAALPFDQIFSVGNVDFNTGHTIGENSNVTDSYTASNLLAAGYVSFVVPVTERLRILPGLRTEFNHQKLQTARGVGQSEVDNPITSFLPFLNMSYDLTTTSLIRLAYSKTVNRPEFREIAPFSFYDFDNQADILGNGNLKVADIHNLDLRWEYYPSPTEFISIGTFYKRFINPIETTIDPGADNAVFLFNNADRATNYGAEVEIRKALAYTSASGFLNNTSLVLNAAYIFSEINLRNDGQLVERANRPMQGQSPYIVNAGLYYQHDKSGWQANVQYNVFGKRIALVGVPGAPTWWEMPRNLLDITVSKQLSPRTQLRLGISDLLNARILFREDANLDTNLGDAETNKIVRQTRNGQYVSLTVAVKL